MTAAPRSDSWDRMMTEYLSRPILPRVPTLPPSTTQPTGWGTEADKLVNLHGL